MKKESYFLTLIYGNKSCIECSLGISYFMDFKTQFNDFYFPGNRVALSKSTSWFSSEIGAAVKPQQQKNQHATRKK